MIQKIRYPQPYKEVPQWMNLNGAWEFSFDTPAYDRTIEVPYPWGSPLSGIAEEKDGTAYYRRSVQWNPENPRIFLHFGAVDYTCTVTVNGKELGSHKGGYMPFSFEVTDIWDRAADNIIEVLTFVVARHMIIASHAAQDLLLSAVAILLLYGTRLGLHWFRSKMDVTVDEESILK